MRHAWAVIVRLRTPDGRRAILLPVLDRTFRIAVIAVLVIGGARIVSSVTASLEYMTERTGNARAAHAARGIQAEQPSPATLSEM